VVRKGEARRTALGEEVELPRRKLLPCGEQPPLATAQMRELRGRRGIQGKGSSEGCLRGGAGAPMREAASQTGSLAAAQRKGAVHGLLAVS